MNRRALLVLFGLLLAPAGAWAVAPPAEGGGDRVRITVTPAGVDVDGKQVLKLECRFGKKARPCKGKEALQEGASFHSTAGHKPEGRADGFLLVPLKEALDRAVGSCRLEATRKGRRCTLVGEVRVDARIEYRTIAEVLYTAGQAGIDAHNLAVIGKPEEKKHTRFPKIEKGKGGCGDVPLGLLVAITPSGFSLKWQQGGAEHKAEIPAVRVSPERCAEGAPDPARYVRHKRTCRAYDHAALYNKLVELKKAFPLETRVNVGASPSVAYRVVADTLDTTQCLRNTDRYDSLRAFDKAPERPAGGSGRCLMLFPEVVFVVLQ